ncbi:porin family protein [Flavobacterium antarcticum]|uniref:porin family protein n=1 Tax=Flavobacterium antarcticum TaxID=271155 RepID=UPI001B7FECD4|nr:porin family protein [Flavobacterium antarcticum]
MDSRKNPTDFEYRLTEEGESKKGTVKTALEFGISGVFKYVKAKVNIDKSKNDLTKMSKNNDPQFIQEELFLKVIVEGKSTLFQYVDENIIRYFYSKKNGTVEQLIFKKYLTADNQIATNNAFREQLWNDLKCSNFTIDKVENIKYNKKDLVRYFSEYSACNDVALIDFAPKQKRDFLNITFRPRINSSSLSIENSMTNNRSVDFGNKVGFGFGLEAEFILPFNKNKWSIAVEPTYQNFKSEKTTASVDVVGGQFTTKIDYTSIDLPISLRHYFFLNSNSKLFLNASIVLDFSSKSTIDFTRADDSLLDSLEIEAHDNYAFGFGYKLYDKYSVEFRYQTREPLSTYAFWGSSYGTSSLIVGYSIF